MNTKIRAAGILGALTIAVAACGGGATPSPSASSPASSQPAASAGGSEAPSGSGSAAAPLSGELTLWHSYGSGGGETGALNKVLDKVRAENPDLKVNVAEQPFDQIFNKWNTDVGAGGGPDLFIAPNDSLFTQVDGGVLENLDDELAGKLEGIQQVAIDGSKVDGSFYMVPESLKAVALWYDKSAIPTPPASADELLAAVKDGSIKLGINQGVYHQFGWTGAFGGTLMDDTGKCIADQGGFSDAFAYLKSLKDAGATFNTDGGALDTDFKTGKINAIIDGPWTTADFRTALGDKLAVTPIPDGPGGKANPFTGTDGWYINPNSPNKDLAVQFALLMTDPANSQIFVDDAGHVPVNPAVTISDPLTQGFSDAAAAGLPRPQNAQFGNWWAPFGDALNKVIDTGADPATAVKDACTTMNQASGIQ
jgi:arabinogalactan oligomer/maltooligosaccharide transport system substrate-binding protein